MLCSIIDLREKQVISISDGTLIGFVDDIEFDTNEGVLKSIIVADKKKFLLLSKDDGIRISWDSIKVIGNDSILVDASSINLGRQKRKKIGEMILNKL